MKENRKISSESILGIATMILSVLGLFFTTLSYSTGYYTFGKNFSWLVIIFALEAIIIETIAVGIGRKYDNKLWSQLLTFAVSGLLIAAVFLLMADRVEAIGTCVITDYDSGHGGEQAVFLSIGAALAWVAAIVYNIIGAFAGTRDAVASLGEIKKKFIVILVSAAFVFAGIFYGFGSLAGVFGTSAKISSTGSNTTAAGVRVYSVSFSQNNGNAGEDKFPDYQFLTGDFSGLVRADARFYVDEQLTLHEDGSYELLSDAYVVETGKRCEIGDDTGLGLKLTCKATGTYRENEDGTITTSSAEHAVIEVATDTYSSQMRAAVSMKVGDVDEDGSFDSTDCPEVLYFVPETIWTVTDDGMIVTYKKAGESADEAAEAAESGEEAADNEETTAEGLGVEIPSEDGATYIAFHADGSYTFRFPQYNIAEEGTYSYENGVLKVTNSNGLEMMAEGDSISLHYISGVSDSLTGDFTISSEYFNEL